MIKLFILCLVILTSIQIELRHDKLLNTAIIDCKHEVELQYSDDIGVDITESEYNELFIECETDTSIY